MLFHLKLGKLLELHNSAAVARAAGLSKYTLLGLLQGKHKPKIETALRLARIIGVDPGWLIDDKKNWPPVRATPEIDLEPAVA